MKTWYLLLLLLFLGGCDSYPQYHIRYEEYPICSEDSTEKRAKFILDCIKSANPKSDEEPEGWLSYCEEFAIDMYCTKQVYSVRYIVQCASCGSEMISKEVLEEEVTDRHSE